MVLEPETWARPTVAPSAAATDPALVVAPAPLPAPPLPAPVAAAPASPPSATPAARRKQLLVRLLPVGIIAVGLLTAVGRDLLFREPAEMPLPEVDYAHPVLDLRFHDQVRPEGVPVPAVSMRFGLGVPDASKPGTFKTKLIYDEEGRTCNVCVRIDKQPDYFFGLEQGTWKVPIKEPLGKDLTGRQPIGAQATWVRNGPPPITIKQLVEIVPGGLSADGSKRLLDTCLVRYYITNEDTVPHEVGLRFLLDTFIGTNDAVPFTIAGAGELCDSMKTFNKPDEVPDYISALERQDLKNPGTVAHLNLKYAPGAGLEPPSRVTLGAWPAPELRKQPGGIGAEMQNTRWEVPVFPMALAKSAGNPNGDSAVTMYWDDKKVMPKETRIVGFAYGLGSVSGDKGEGQLGITAGGEVVEKKEFTLTAYVKNPAPGTTITLALPKGMQLAGGNLKETVPPLPPGSSSAYSPVTWRVKAFKPGIQRVWVTLNTGATLQHRLVIGKAGVFN
jgi:hypothetical protein